MHSNNRSSILYAGIFLFLYSLFALILMLRSSLFPGLTILQVSIVVVLSDFTILLFAKNHKIAWIFYGLILILISVFISHLYIVDQELKVLQPSIANQFEIRTLYAKTQDPVLNTIGFLSQDEKELEERSALFSNIERISFSSKKELFDALDQNKIQGVVIDPSQSEKGLVALESFAYSIPEFGPVKNVDLLKNISTILIKDKNGFSLLQIDPIHHSLLVRKHLSSFDQKNCQKSLGSMQACSEEELALPINYAIDLKIKELDFFQWQRIPLFWNPNLNQESVLTNMSASSMKDLFLLPLDTYSNITR
ncbi:hypothetical protein [Dubosiella newyorkensis]|jgi:hypothetical protein|uniref:hypothetical protein n=3 Tax=Dubosiella newyorkensis TaxID=1862672 RepID=UPI0023567B7D|nr:hypothetical protein [Dubosiella newyorkensis]MCI9041317.1 hypothetical protein [Dubosiella newyorkensis]